MEADIAMMADIARIPQEALVWLQTNETCGEWGKFRSYEYEYNRRTGSQHLD